jgi:hypothetical protein
MRRNTIRDASSGVVSGSKDKTLAGVERGNRVWGRGRKNEGQKQNIHKNLDQ